MRLRNITTFWLATIALAFVCSVNAESNRWQSGLIAFEKGEFEEALTHFQLAHDDGQDGPAIHYNIAVCQFKTGRFSDSARSFEELRDRYPQFTGLAEYNLGLIERRRGDLATSLKHFRHAYSASEDDQTLRSLAAEMILRLQPDEKPAVTRHAYASLGIQAGYDDNVALRDELNIPAGQSQDSTMTDLYVVGRLPVAALPSLQLDGALYAVRYFEVGQFDQNIADAGLSLTQEGRRWLAEAGAYYNYSTIGGDGFEQGPSLRLRVNRRLSDFTTIGLRYEFADVSSANATYSGIEGTRQRIELVNRWDNEADYLSISVRADFNDRRNPAVSADRLGIRVKYRRFPAGPWFYDASLGYRHSVYRKTSPDIRAGLISLHLGATRLIRDDWYLSVVYEFNENDSTDPMFSYERNRLILGINRTF